jgi:hypothetical protein
VQEKLKLQLISSRNEEITRKDKLIVVLPEKWLGA